jgi:hypothetical protein
MRKRILIGAFAGIAFVTLAACGGDDAATNDATGAAAATTTLGTATTLTSSVTTTIARTATTVSAVVTTTTIAAAAGGKVNANTASIAELQKAFEAAGISQALRWAQEVDEYRPYPSDPKWGKLRQELGKYNIAPDVLEKIISLLEV